MAGRRTPVTVDGYSSDLLARLDDESRQLRQAQRLSRVGSWHWPVNDSIPTVSDVLLETTWPRARDVHRQL